jgi:hypothetical protein
LENRKQDRKTLFESTGSFTKVKDFVESKDVNASERVFEGGWIPRSFLLLAGGSFLGLVLITLVAMQLRPSVTLAKRQASLLDGIERRSPARIQRLVADDYEDRWGFEGDDLAVTMVDAGGQFLALIVTPEEEEVEIEGDRATITARLVIGGRPVGPAGQEVMQQINRLEEPFVFTWERKSFLPGSWRLVRVDNAALPGDLHGYEPGDFRRAMRGE